MITSQLFSSGTIRQISCCYSLSFNSWLLHNYSPVELFVRSVAVIVDLLIHDYFSIAVNCRILVYITPNSFFNSISTISSVTIRQISFCYSLSFNSWLLHNYSPVELFVRSVSVVVYLWIHDYFTTILQWNYSSDPLLL